MRDRFHDVVRTPVGDCVLIAGPRGLLELRFDPEGNPGVPRDRRAALVYADAVRAYFGGGEFPRVPLDLSWATGFQRRVYSVVRAIPRGRLLSYGEVARRAGRAGGARAVGRAMGANRACLAVP